MGWAPATATEPLWTSVPAEAHDEPGLWKWDATEAQRDVQPGVWIQPDEPERPRNGRAKDDATTTAAHDGQPDAAEPTADGWDAEPGNEPDDATTTTTANDESASTNAAATHEPRHVYAHEPAWNAIHATATATGTSSNQSNDG